MQSIIGRPLPRSAMLPLSAIIAKDMHANPLEPEWRRNSDDQYTGADLAEKTAANTEGDETMSRADACDTCMLG